MMHKEPASIETIITVVTMLLSVALVFAILGRVDQIIVPVIVLFGWLVSELIVYTRRIK